MNILRKYCGGEAKRDTDLVVCVVVPVEDGVHKRTLSFWNILLR